MTKPTLHIIGAGLAGSEAAWQAAEMGVSVVIHEMRPNRMTDAHKTAACAELVCSNSFRSDDCENNAVGLLHEEMRRCNSLIMQMGDKHKVPAGSALAVDRDLFSDGVTEALKNHPNISFSYEEMKELPPSPLEVRANIYVCGWGHSKALPNQAPLLTSPLLGEKIKESWIVATGPLTSPSLSQSILEATGETYLSFFDAIAPIVSKESVDMGKAWMQSRYDKVGPGGNGADYINCPMSEEEYNTFIDALLAGEKTEFKEWEKNTPYFEGCLPIEVMAERGRQTLAYGPMKPVGLTNPHTGKQAYAVVQLRQDNKLGTLYNMVGFQTKLKYGEQQRIFKTIPGLENADFVRLGGIHRNTFINSPVLLDSEMRLKKQPHIRFAGQVTGVEGYVESAATGILSGRFAASELLGQPLPAPAAETALGALLRHITGGANAETFQPMNINYGLLPPLPKEGKRKIGKRERGPIYAKRALAALQEWLNNSEEKKALFDVVIPAKAGMTVR